LAELTKAIIERLTLLIINKLLNDRSDEGRKKYQTFIDYFIILPAEQNFQNFAFASVACILSNHFRVQLISDAHVSEGNSLFIPVDDCESLVDQWEYISQLSCFRRIENYVAELCEDIQIRIIDVDSSLRALRLCELEIIFTKNSETCESGRSIINLEIDRATGELYFPSCTIAFSQILAVDQKAYDALKTRIYRVLISYLESKDEDIDELLVSKPNDDSSVSLIEGEIIRLEVAEVIGYVSYTNVSLHRLESIAPQINQTLSRPKSNLVSRLKGLRGDRVLQVLRKLLGDPRNNGGSHFIFTGRNNCNFPIAVHPSSTVPIGLLKKCLQMWDLPIEEFLEAI
jgi:predicted RNA binding protein YcfA (HicA-like mRNA interferase family)